jgi:hypothetical protein
MGALKFKEKWGVISKSENSFWHSLDFLSWSAVTPNALKHSIHNTYNAYKNTMYMCTLSLFSNTSYSLHWMELTLSPKSIYKKTLFFGQTAYFQREICSFKKLEAIKTVKSEHLYKISVLWDSTFTCLTLAFLSKSVQLTKLSTGCFLRAATLA